MGLFQIISFFVCFLLFETCVASTQRLGRIYLGFQASQTVYIDNKLVSCCEKLVFVFEFNERMRKGSKGYQKQISLYLISVRRRTKKKKKNRGEQRVIQGPNHPQGHGGGSATP
jgi:hypothetical protein